MRTDDDVRALFEAECDRLQEQIRSVMKPPGFDTMDDEGLVICHRAAVAALVSLLSELLIVIPTTREQVRLGALAVLAPIPSAV